MLSIHARPCRLAVAALALCLGAGLAGCQRKKSTDAGKTYTSDKGGAAASSGGDSKDNNKPLNSPADTTDSKSSQASDDGSSGATKGQVVAEPGAPVEHDKQQAAPQQPTRGH